MEAFVRDRFALQDRILSSFLYRTVLYGNICGYWYPVFIFSAVANYHQWVKPSPFCAPSTFCVVVFLTDRFQLHTIPETTSSGSSKEHIFRHPRLARISAKPTTKSRRVSSCTSPPFCAAEGRPATHSHCVISVEISSHSNSSENDKQKFYLAVNIFLRKQNSCCEQV